MKIPIGNAALYLGDCLDVMQTFDDSSVDMVLCDLPYGTTRNKWDSVIPLALLWREYRRVTKPNAAIVLFSQGVFTAKLILSNEADFKYKYSWIKGGTPTGFLNAKKQPLRQSEDICIFYRKQSVYNPQLWFSTPYKTINGKMTSNWGKFTEGTPTESVKGERYPTDVFYCKGSKKHGHPTAKPVELNRWLIRTYTNLTDVILDNTFGSCSAGLAALLEQRRFIGIEQNPKYYWPALDRLLELDAYEEKQDFIAIGEMIKHWWDSGK